MARNGSGVYTNPYPNFVAGTVISSTEVDANNAAMGTALTGSIAADGQTTITGNLPMATNKFTGLGAGSASTDSANLGQVQASAYIWCGTMGGAADAGTLSPTPAITAYAAGQRFAWKASTNSNTGAMTVAISGLSTIAVQDDRAALSAGGHVASDIYMGILDTTSTMQIMKVASGSSVPGSSSITTAMLQNSAVTAAKIASDAVETAKINDSAVTTAKINNDAVTLAKLASGTDGNIISYDASGNPVAIATGSDGQVLTSAGAGAQPAFESLPSGGPSQATQAEVEAESNVDKYIPPDLINFHPGVAKGWVVYNQVANSILVSLNVSSITDTAAGQFDVLWDTDFSSANFAVALSVRYNSPNPQENNYNAAGGTRVYTVGDYTRNYVISFGDQS